MDKYLEELTKNLKNLENLEQESNETMKKAKKIFDESFRIIETIDDNNEMIKGLVDANSNVINRLKELIEMRKKNEL